MSNILYTNDNLYIMHGMNSNIVDLIYLDPPFNSKRMYSAPIGSKAAGASFKDMWTWKDIDEVYLETLADKYPTLVNFIANAGATYDKSMMSYLTYMSQRIIEMHRILKDTGSIYLHCDATASHYLKIVMDEIFGKNNFRNEIIWCYSTSGRATEFFSKKHDIILFYTKSKKYFWNKDYREPYTESYINSHFKHIDDKGRRCRIRIDAGKERIYYPEKGMIPNDWWEIPYVNSQAKERTGYPTQKPLVLLKRIIEASSKYNDLVFDPFCGCATACVAAQQLGRRWIGIDIEKQAAKVLIDRLSDDAGLFKDFIATTKIPKRTDIVEEIITESVKERLYKDQKGKCNACGVEMDIFQFEIDHIIPKAKGGGDYYENYQLLCPHCNRTKGDRPMEYLRMKIKTREQAMKTKIVFGD